MRSIIVGAGKVGFSIAATLADKGHDVIVIDIDKDRLNLVEDYLDVKVVEGSGAQMSVLEEAGIKEADLLVAVTEGDELNMVSCFIAKSYGVKSTIARVREPGYAEIDNSQRQRQLGIDLIINPEKVAAKEIMKFVLYPEAHDVEYYADGQVLLLGLKIKSGHNIIGKSLLEINFPKPCVVVAILRDEKILIPTGNDVFQDKDEIFVLSDTKDMHKIEEFIGIKHKVINDIAIFGGDLLGYYLAEIFEKKRRRFSVKLFEKNAELCDELNEKFNSTLVINGSGINIDLLDDENVGEMDVAISVTDDDKENVMISMIAKHMGVPQTIAQVRHSDYINMVEKFGVDKAISPRRLTSTAILRFINRGRILNLKMLEDDMAQMNELIIPENPKIAGKSLKQMHFPKGAIIGLIVRNNNIIIPSGDDKLFPGDRVLLFALTEAAKIVGDYLTKNER